MPLDSALPLMLSLQKAFFSNSYLIPTAQLCRNSRLTNTPRLITEIMRINEETFGYEH